MERNNRLLSVSKFAIIGFVLLLLSCRDYKMEDFCGEWQYKDTRYILHEDGTLEVYNLDSIFIYWDDYNKEYNKGTWTISDYGRDIFENPRLHIVYDGYHGCEYFVESDDKLRYYIGDPDDWNLAIIRKKSNKNRNRP